MKAPLCTSTHGAREPIPAAVVEESEWRPTPAARPLHLRAIAGLAGVLALMSPAASIPMARAAPEASDDGVPQAFDTAACYQLVQDTGRIIAWARWELGASEDKVVAQFEEGTPEWIVDLTDRWIADAYHWKVTDDQVQQWASELGDGAAWPRAEELTTPQTIAIWLRRIARQCHELHV